MSLFLMKYYVMSFVSAYWSILGLVDLYDAIWSGEYQNDLGVAIAS